METTSWTLTTEPSPWLCEKLCLAHEGGIVIEEHKELEKGPSDAKQKLLQQTEQSTLS